MVPSLEDHLQSVLAYATSSMQQLERLELFLPHDDDEPLGLVSDKVIAETALLLLLSSRASCVAPKLLPAVDALRREVGMRCRSIRTQVMLMRFPQTAVTLGLPHILLTALGDGDDDFDRLLDGAFETGQVETGERLPFRTMDMNWVLAQRGHQMPHGEAVLEGSIIRRCPEPAYASRSDAYALTHAVMYLTDFGHRRLPDDVDVEDICRLIDGLLIWCGVSNDLDLLGELVMARALCAKERSAEAAAAWSLLEATWTTRSLLPGPNYDDQRAAALEGDAAIAYRFEHSYHTTYVFGMLCAVLLTGGAPPASAAVRTVSLDKRLVTRLGVGSDQAFAFVRSLAAPAVAGPQATQPDAWSPSARDRIVDLALGGRRWTVGPLSWIETVQSADFGECVAELCLDAMLVMGMRTYDLALLAELLELWLESSIVMTPIIASALRFVLAQQLPSGAIGAYFLSEGNVHTAAAASLTAAFAPSLRKAANRASR